MIVPLVKNIKNQCKKKNTSDIDTLPKYNLILTISTLLILVIISIYPLLNLSLNLKYLDEALININEC